MKDDKNISDFKANNQNIVENKALNFFEALIPVILLMGLLFYNIVFADGELLGTYSNQFILLIGAP
ncbi:Na+/H+ antiporter NhaC [Jejuia pallidilutea]|uniref:Na+/H+ antiporter NhaC n=1 Tax=Jejuia pallidilutea TaxID=504487 RepID=A0A090VV91_9FLAO|nr:Na+/H+ antiporter NhaC [Jejuia pallidilutea]